jgi:aromatic ring hydroxylase
MLRTKEQYLESLFTMKPNIHMEGKRVGRDDPRLMPGINVLSTTYDLAHNPGWKNLAVIHSQSSGTRSVDGLTFHGILMILFRSRS